jgi:K+-transporting ATPase ATPase C chain
MSVLRELRPAAILLGLFTLLTGIVYPAVMTFVAEAAFGGQARGSLIDVDGRARGSDLIGQAFSDPAWFWSRPSATTPVPYNGGASTGTNQGPLNPALSDAVKQRIEALREADPENRAAIPVDLVTASGSGLDPHISPAAAIYQVNRVARARGVAVDGVQRLVEDHVEARIFGVLGAPRVNVVRLNLALERLAPRPATPPAGA